MKHLLFVSLLVLPAIVSADTFQNLNDVLEWVLNLVNDFFIPLLVALALLAFFWRNIVSLAKKDELVAKAEARTYLFWGLIALFVMVSVWGLVGILADALGIRNAIPQLNTSGGSTTTLPPCETPRTGAPCDEGSTIPPCTPGQSGPCTNPWD